MRKRAAAINDLSGFGGCSLVADISVLTAMGIECCPLPSAVLSAETAYEGYVCTDFADRMPSYMHHWQTMPASFDGILSGFLTGEAEVQNMLAFLDVFQREDNLVLVDPVMADGGKPYANYSDALLEGMKKLTARADILTPNLSELCLLAGEDPMNACTQDAAWLRDHAEKMAASLLCRPGQIITVTGVPVEDRTKIGTLLVQADHTQLYTFARTGGNYSGCGDLFAAVMLGGLLRKETAEDTVQLAGNFIAKGVKDACEAEIPPEEGIIYEPYLHELKGETK